MAKIKVKKLKYLTILFTGLISGFLLGCVCVTALVGYRIDKYHERISYLEWIIDDKNTKLEKLEESVNKKRFIVSDIEVYLVFAGDDLERISLVKHIKAKYNHLIGKEVRNIDADSLETILDNRIFKLGNKEYKLNVNKLVLSDVLKIWVEARQMQ